MIDTIQNNQPQRNYRIFNTTRAQAYCAGREASLPILAEQLRKSQDENEIVEDLFILNKMIDSGVKDAKSMYPVLSRFNNTNSPAIQTFLAGIYRKLQIPDAFGPLVAMLIRNSINPPNTNFNPNEEIGGAIISYLSDRFRN